MNQAQRERSTFQVYIDESSQTGHDFMVVGAIFCSTDAARDVAQVMDQCLLEHEHRRDLEFHWTELKGHTLGLYKDAMSKLIGFTLGRRKMRYRALVVDMTQIKPSLNTGLNREAALARLVFALVFGFARRCSPHIRYNIWIDRRADSVHDLEMDRRILHALNTMAKAEWGWADGPFAGVYFVDSRKSRLIQATDMITGAVAYETNQKHLRPDASAHRIALLQHVIACTTLSTLATELPRWPVGFQIRRFDFADGRRI